jgi:hypothetical protein
VSKSLKRAVNQRKAAANPLRIHHLRLSLGNTESLRFARSRGRQASEVKTEISHQKDQHEIHRLGRFLMSATLGWSPTLGLHCSLARTFRYRSPRSTLIARRPSAACLEREKVFNYSRATSPDARLRPKVSRKLDGKLLSADKRLEA